MASECHEDRITRNRIIGVSDTGEENPQLSGLFDLGDRLLRVLSQWDDSFAVRHVLL